MASREKTRDELDLQTLRELASLPANKFCFDCGQRGPTYVNVTIGAFVCSACGGLLRGLNPPHRVKSLTVCSYTEVEMDRIKSRGNEYCTHIWLGKYDNKSSDMDLSNREKLKEFMIQKYEEKRYYVDPKEAIKKMKPRAPAVPTCTGNSVTRSYTVVSNPNKSFSGISRNSVPDLFKAFDKDPFKSQPQTETVMDGASFADFSSAFGENGCVNDSASGQLQTTVSSTPSSTSHKKPAPPPPDRYAALADLDNQQHQQVPPADTVTSLPQVLVSHRNSPVFWTSVNPAMSNIVYAPPIQHPFGATIPSRMQANPFGPLPQFPVRHMSEQFPIRHVNVPQPTANGVPKPSLNNGDVGSVWPVAAGDPTWGGPYPMQQADPFLMNHAPVVDSSNPWAQALATNGVNPFANSFLPNHPSSAPGANTAKNPFL